MLKTAALVTALAVAALATVHPHRLGARAPVKLCATQPEDGTWKNVDAATRGIPRIQLRFTCQDQILNGQPYPPGAPWHIHVWGKCSPTNCDWGEVDAQRQTTGWIFGQYHQGYARRFVWARMSAAHPGQLWVYVWTDFASASRADYTFTGYFVHE